MRIVVWEEKRPVRRPRQISGQANQFAASQEIPRNFWNLKVHYRFNKCLQPAPILNQINPFHPPQPTSWRSILILSSYLCLGVFQVIFFFEVSPPKPCIHLSSPPYMLHVPPTHFSRFDHPNNIGWVVQIIKLHVMQFSPLHYYVVLKDLYI